MSPMFGKTFANDLQVPVRDGLILESSLDPFPKSLHVLDLLVRGKLVEARRWKRKSQSHGISIAEAFYATSAGTAS